ncbi:hypothetical protein SBA3_520009 [Candidatus Sulfopaludibacter sp. SbA3]|nr:hypothetical protein SBA3_520009 [Candidatus Sulfopaludibacter sp. SbA3]
MPTFVRFWFILVLVTNGVAAVYPGSTEDLPNPERGFYVQTAYNPERGAVHPLDAAFLRHARENGMSPPCRRSKRVTFARSKPVCSCCPPNGWKPRPGADR